MDAFNHYFLLFHIAFIKGNKTIGGFVRETGIFGSGFQNSRVNESQCSYDSCMYELMIQLVMCMTVKAVAIHQSKEMAVHLLTNFMVVMFHTTLLHPNKQKYVLFLFSHNRLFTT